MTDRFDDWQSPIITNNQLNKYNWLVQYSDNFFLGYKTDIGAFTYINAKYKVIIEDECQIGSHCSIYSQSTIGNIKGQVLIKKRACIGSHSTILPGITVGKNSIVGAHSLVLKSIPDNVIAYGVPAKVVSSINE